MEKTANLKLNLPAQGTADWRTGFAASRCSTVYGKSSTVQPPAYIVNIWRRVS